MKPVYTNDFYTKTIVASNDYTIRLMKDVCHGNKWEYTLDENIFTFSDTTYHQMLGVLHWNVNHRENFERQNSIITAAPENIKDDELEPFALRRIKICRECEHYKAFICSQCGCFMPLKTKLKGAECPKQKWLKEIN
jgi:hypothetical protein